MQQSSLANPLEIFTKILKYNKQVPRYTSYPAAPNFSPKIDAKIYESWLKNLAANESISLYFHIPFCQQMCWYCGCFTKISKRYAPIENYANFLLREIKMVAEILGSKRSVKHIHFGGGSPTILLPETFAQIMKVVRQNFIIEPYAEIAIEVDPRSINEEKIATYAKEKVNRVSIGVQDFNLEVQQAINREQSFEMVYDAVKLFRKYGIDNINLDLIYGLPKQDIEGMKRNIDFALLLKPKRIALFSYAHVPWMKKHMRLIDESQMPSDLDKLKIYHEVAQKLKNAGFVAIGLDHFASIDDELSRLFFSKNLKRNFQGYSSDNAGNIIGFGASSIGYLRHKGYVQNVAQIEEYEKKIKANELPIARGYEFQNDDILRKKLIDHLMCYMGIDLDEFCAQHDLPKDFFAEEISKLAILQQDGLISLENNLIAIDANAGQIVRVVSSFFDKYFCDSGVGAKHSKIA